MLCASLDGSGVWGRMDTCICVAESLPCLPETTTILLIGCFVVQLPSRVWLFVTPMDCTTPGLPVLPYLPEFALTHVHSVGDVIQPSHPISSPSPPAFNLSPTPQFKSINSSVVTLLYGPTLRSIHDYRKNNSFDYTNLCQKVMSLLFNMLFRLVIAFLTRSKCLLISRLQSPSTVIVESKK